MRVKRKNDNIKTNKISDLKTENEEFLRKYRTFQLHKWTYLKCIKSQMIKKKKQEMNLKTIVRTWHLRYALQKIIDKYHAIHSRNVSV